MIVSCLPTLSYHHQITKIIAAMTLLQDPQNGPIFARKWFFIVGYVEIFHLSHPRGVLLVSSSSDIYRLFTFRYMIYINVRQSLYNMLFRHQIQNIQNIILHNFDYANAKYNGRWWKWNGWKHTKSWIAYV